MKHVQCDKQGITCTVDAIRNGGIVIFPTDTVYGIGCNPYDLVAVKKIYKIKNRKITKPFPILVGSINDALKIAEFNEIATTIVKKFWPGKVSIILKLRDKTLKKSMNLTQDKIAIRIPSNTCLLKILKECHFLVGTSANLSGNNPFTDPKTRDNNIVDGFDVFLDDGKINDDSKASTIIDLTNNDIKLVRSGAISVDEIYNVIGEKDSR